MDAGQIGSEVRRHRKLAGLTRQEMCELGEIGKTALYDLERGKPTIRLDVVLAACRVLNLKLELKSPLMEIDNGTVC